MTKATSRRRHLVGGWLAVSEGESMVIRSGSMAAGRQERYRRAHILIHSMGQNERLALVWAPVTHLL